MPLQTRVLIIHPEEWNYFYDVQAMRLADALGNLGCAVSRARLDSFAVQEYDCCLLVNVAEIIHAYLTTGKGTLDAALGRFRLLRDLCDRRYLVLMECANTAWFADNSRWCQGLGINALIDLGLCDQRADLTGHWKAYRFLFNGLTAQERLQVHDAHSTPEQRPIPWAFIGTFSRERANIAWRLIQEVDSRGVLYLRNPETGPIAWSGPHFNYHQFLQVQRAARCSVWCAHHEHFYLESERFRAALLAGTVPLKIQLQRLPAHVGLPFADLLLEEADFGQRMSQMAYDRVWHRFREEYLQLPSLETGLSRVLEE